MRNCKKKFKNFFHPDYNQKKLYSIIPASKRVPDILMVRCKLGWCSDPLPSDGQQSEDKAVSLLQHTFDMSNALTKIILKLFSILYLTKHKMKNER